MSTLNTIRAGILSRRVFWRISLLLLVLLVAAMTPAQVFALDSAQRQLYDAGVQFWDRTTICGTVKSGSGSLAGNTNAERIWNYLRSQGLSAEQTAGVMGNIQVESGFSPTRQQDGSTWPSGGWGLVQWTGGRRGAIFTKLGGFPDLKEYATPAYGGPIPADAGGKHPGIPEDINLRLLNFELDYMMQESQARRVSRTVAGQGYGTAGANEWETLKQQNTVEAATVFWHNNFEVSADTPAEVLSSRGKLAQDIYNTYVNTSGSGFSGGFAGAGGGGGGGGACDPAASLTAGDLASYVKAYAHPQWHDPVYTNMMPEYAKAVSRAQEAGLYVGGDNLPGIDCGGFVTLLLVNSGFDRRYNYDGGGGNTVYQQGWVEENWSIVGKGDAINPADLQPGDVAFRPGHTFVFVGTVPGFDSTIASASLKERSPMAGKEEPTDPRITWYRKKA